MQQHGSKYLASRPQPPPPTLEVKGQTPTFTEHGHFANQIKGNYDCNNIAANILPADPLGPSGQKVKIDFFIIWPCRISKLRNGAQSTMQAHIISLHTSSSCALDLKVKQILKRGKKYRLT